MITIDAINAAAAYLMGILVLGKRTTVADAAYTAQASDMYIGYTTLTAGRTVTGPSGVPAGFILILKDEAGAAAVNNLTFAPASGNIDGSATKAVVAANFGVARLYFNGTNWFTI